MRVGLLLDNNPIGTMPADSSFAKLRAMRATAIGTLWTAGTKHRRAVYERCERELARPLYILRIGGHRQSPTEWLADARAALAEVPPHILLQDRLVLTAGNEPNIEFSENGADYGRFYAGLNAPLSSVPILFACPSLGIDGWSRYLAAALAEAGKPTWGIVNLYAGNVGRVADFAGVFPDGLYIGEVNSPANVRGAERVAFLQQAFRALERAGVKAATIFIAGGTSYGAWDEGYIISESEASALGEALTGGSEVKPMASVAVAILPSNQIHNVSKIRPDYNEMGGMCFLAPMIEAACQHLGMNARWFQPQPEVQGDTQLKPLRAQLTAGYSWLSRQPQAKKIGLSIHTDSGSSHTYGIFASSKSLEGGALAAAIAVRVHKALGTAWYQAIEKLGSVNYNTYLFATLAPAETIPVLIEICAHNDEHDINMLYAHPRETADAIAQGIAEFAQINDVDWESRARSLQSQVDLLRAKLGQIRELAAV